MERTETKEVITQKISIEELQKLFGSGEMWTGYLWQDDEYAPFVFKGEPVIYGEYFTTKIPFIIEGFLVNETATISVTIKNIDGVYYCYKSEGFAGLENVQKFPAHEEAFKNTGVKALKFIPVFKKQEDSLSPNFQEYVYSHQIFKGIVS